MMSEERTRSHLLRMVHEMDQDQAGNEFKCRFGAVHTGEGIEKATPAQSWTPLADQEVRWGAVIEAWKPKWSAFRDGCHQSFWGTDLGHDSGASGLLQQVRGISDCT